ESVAVRICLPGDERVSRPDHRPRHVRVEIERSHNRDRLSDDRTDGRKQIAFEMPGLVDRRRAVQREQHAVDRHLALETREQFGLRVVVAGGGARGAGAGAGDDERSNRRPAFAEHTEHSSDGAPRALEHFRTVEQLRSSKRFEVGRGPAEMIAFDEDRAQSDRVWHGGSVNETRRAGKAGADTMARPFARLPIVLRSGPAWPAQREDSMKIDRVETMNLLFEYADGFEYAGGKCTGRLTTLVLVHCDNGMLGVGSCYTHPAL